MTDYSTTECDTEIKAKSDKARRSSTVAFGVLCIFMTLFSFAVLAFAKNNTDFAERYAVTVSDTIRRILACLTGWLPFSLAETLVITAVPIVVFTLFRAVILRFAYRKKGRVLAWLVRLLYAASVCLFLFVNAFGVCYYRMTLADMLGLDTDDISQSDVEIASVLSLEFASQYSDSLIRLSDGSTKMPYSFDEMCEKICDGYAEIVTNMPKHISVKPVALSEPWTYTHISGMYFPITGESNVNVNYPDYTLAFSAAHEIAHQLGIAREDEANMMAFLACVYSGDEYLVYSAFLNASEYLVGSLPSQRAIMLYSAADNRLIDEMRAYAEFSSKYSNTAVSAVSSAVNDGYLKANGVDTGRESYSEVTLILTSYIKSVFVEAFTD